jgi:hypothetical protein
MMTSTLPLSELKRLTPPFANEADEEEAFRYWKDRTIEEKLAASTQLTLDHYRELGIDVDKPMNKTIVRRTVSWAMPRGD